MSKGVVKKKKKVVKEIRICVNCDGAKCELCKFTGEYHE